MNANVDHKKENWFYGNAASKIHGNAKDLNYLWYTQDKTGKYIQNPHFKNLHECNTILVDDHPKNTINPSNRKNTIKVEAFATFGEVKDRSDPYKDMSNDNMLLKCLDIFEKAQNILNRPDIDEYHNIFSYSEFDYYKQGNIPTVCVNNKRRYIKKKSIN